MSNNMAASRGILGRTTSKIYYNSTKTNAIYGRKFKLVFFKLFLDKLIYSCRNK